MASVSQDPSGSYRIQFQTPDGKRKTLRLPTKDKKVATSIGSHVEHLVASRISGSAVPPATAAWLASVTDPLRSRLVKVGLIDPVATSTVPTLGEFLDEHLRNRAAELKPGTMKVLEQAARWMRRFLGDDVRLDKITVTDADRFRAAILKDRAKATANKWTRYAKEFLNAAVTRGLIDKNPFAHVKGLAVVGDQSRRALVPDADIRRVLDAIPCPQFRLIVALARYAGLRIPSEALTLTWADVNWASNRLVVRATKTAHHSHGGVRVVPIFAELRPFLQEAWDAAESGSEFVITRYRDPATNLRTQFNRWCLAAGVVPWGKPFQNMRATRATELADRFPSHVCASWLGHTERIADQFYRSVTDDHFLRATTEGTKPTQNPTQQRAEPTCKDEKLSKCANEEGVPPPVLASPSILLPNDLMGDTGFEPVTSSV